LADKAVYVCSVRFVKKNSGRSSAEGARIEAPKALREEVWGGKANKTIKLVYENAPECTILK